MMIQMNKKTKHYRGTAVFTALFALFALFATVQFISADELEFNGVDGSTKTVDQPNPEAGDTVRYTIMVSNTTPTSPITVTDMLPTEITYAGNFSATPEISG